MIFIDFLLAAGGHKMIFIDFLLAAGGHKVIFIDFLLAVGGHKVIVIDFLLAVGRHKVIFIGSCFYWHSCLIFSLKLAHQGKLVIRMGEGGGEEHRSEQLALLG